MKIYYHLYEKQTGLQKEKAGHQAGYALLSYALRKEYGIEKLPVIEKGRYGKPYFSEYPQIHFNISHCDGMAACVLAERETGIDVEGKRRVRQAILKKALTESERQELLTYWREEPEMGFLHYWTLKESFIKAIGKGLSYPLCEIEFKLEHREEKLIQISSNQKGWKFFQTIIKGNYLLAVCCDEAESAAGEQSLYEVTCEEMPVKCSNFFNTENTD